MGDSLARRLAGQSVGKAGLALDQSEINRVIAEASKGSKFYENERKKDEELTEKIESLIKKKEALMKGVGLGELSHRFWSSERLTMAYGNGSANVEAGADKIVSRFVKSLYWGCDGIDWIFTRSWQNWKLLGIYLKPSSISIAMRSTLPLRWTESILGSRGSSIDVRSNQRCSTIHR